MASSSEVSDATTGSTLYPVMNRISSMAKTLVGSAMAMVRVAPERARGKHDVLARELGGNGLDDDGIDLEVIEVDGRHPVLAREETRDLLVAHVAEGDEGAPELAAVALLMSESSIDLLAGDEVLLLKELTEL